MPASGDELQRRTLRVLFAAQTLAGLGLAAGGTAGALLARDIAGSEAVSGLPLSTLVVGSAVAAVPVSALSRRAGRRPGLAVALGVGMLGAATVVVAGALGSLALLLAGCALLGVGNVAVLLSRYAATDLSGPEGRGGAIGVVVFATTFGAVAGPNLLGPTGDLAAWLGLPRLTGLFLVTAVAYAASAGVLLALLRPDPLREARRRAAVSAHRPAPPSTAPLRALLAQPAAAAGVAVIVLANTVMIAVMGMTPVHLEGHGAGLGLVGLVISLHIAGMYAPALLTGRVTDRLGAAATARLGVGQLVAAGLLAGLADGASVPLALGLVLLGTGWNTALVSGSALLTSTTTLAERPRVEAVGELTMSAAGAAGGGVGGLVVAWQGYGALALGAAVLAGALLVALALARPAGGRSRPAATAAPTPY
jgi:MFS family permease